MEPRRQGRAFVLGLLAELPRKNCWTIAEHAGDRTPGGMQHLLSRPVDLDQRAGSSSMTCMMSTPKCATMRSAITGPMPLISPEPRYFWIPAAVAGSTVA